MSELKTDVVVVGGGNAALCAALAAVEQGAKVVVLECAPEADRGGNSRYTAGAMRVVFEGVEDLKKIMELSDEEISNTDFGRYSFDDYFDDM
ncbi:MAG: FAD-dependent oxidoreductase, partial [Gammaproteobacteria bacterium]|nr:FAD-dependent oxidoreductase [Gammaproteobacteria bacterium]